MSEAVTAELAGLPEFVCHKRVRAAKIEAVVVCERSYRVDLAGGVSFMADDKLFARGFASPGDYIVVYADGYVSWSPAKAFEEGYSLIDLRPEPDHADKDPDLSVRLGSKPAHDAERVGPPRARE